MVHRTKKNILLLVVAMLPLYWGCSTSPTSTTEDSTTQSVTTNPPSPPGGISVSAKDSQIIITWTSSDSSLSYNLYFGNTQNFKSDGSKKGSVTSPYTLSSLANGTTYYIAVSAVNSDGEEGELSATQNAKPMDGASVESLNAANGGTGTVELTWHAEDEDSSTLTFNTTGGRDPKTNTISNVTSPYSHTGLADGVTYYYDIEVSNSYGSQSWSWVEATPDIKWSRLSYNPTLGAVSFGSGNFLAAGEGGYIAITADPAGGVWNDSAYEYRTVPFYGAAYGNNIWVLAGESGLQVYSTDEGSTWKPGNTGSPSGFLGTYFLNGNFLLLSNGGNVLISQDGNEWSDNETGVNYNLTHAAYGNSVYVAAGASGAVVRSTDLSTWVVISGDDSLTTEATSLIYANNSFYLFNDSGEVTTSSDGTSWASLVSGGEVFSDVIHDGTRFIGVGGSGGVSLIKTSPDGVNWTDVSPGTGYSLKKVAEGDSQYLAIGFNGARITSTDGVIWTDKSSGMRETITDVARDTGGTVLVAVGSRMSLFSSSDQGVTWTDRSPSTGSDSLFSVAYGDSTFIAVGSTGIALSSTDGLTWASENTSTTKWLNSIVHDGNGTRFIAVGENGTILKTTSKGSAWIDLTLPGETRTFENIFNDGTRYVATGTGGLVAYSLSLNGENWTTATIPTAYTYLSGTTDGAGTTLLGSSNSDFLLSTNDSTWEEISMDQSYGEIRALNYRGGKFIAVVGSNIFTSADGRTWTKKGTQFSSSLTLNMLKWGILDNLFMTAGGKGMVATHPGY